MNATRRYQNLLRAARRLGIAAGFTGLLLAGAVRLQGAPGQNPPTSPPQNPPAKSEAKTAPTAPAQKPANVCPNGQMPTRRETPFGVLELCVDSGTPATGQAAPGQAAPAQAAPAAQPPATEPAKPAPGQEKKESPQELSPAVADAVSLNLENADLYQVLRILGSELKINYIVDPAVKGTVTINTSGSVSRKDLFSLLQMILAINNATAVKSDSYYSIVPLSAAKQQPMNFHVEKEQEAAPMAEDAYTLLVVPMKFMPAADMSKILTPFMSPAGQIVVQDKGNIMLITESTIKLRQLQEIINVFDDPVLGRQRVRLFPVTNNLATNLVSELRSVFAGYALSSGNVAIQLIPMQRLNSILAVSPSPEVFPEVESWIKKLDQPAHEAGIRNFVYKVQNAKASDLKEIISNLYGMGSARPSAGAAPLNTSGTVIPENPAAIMGPTGAAPSQTPASRPETQAPAVAMQGDLRIMFDEHNNALIIQATPHDYEIVERTLQELDTLPRQVLIDARIYEVDLTGDLTLGLQAFLDKKGNRPSINTSGSFGGITPSLAFQTFAILHNTYELQVFLNASENRSRVKTLSAPSILVTDNTQARIQVGSEVPVPIGSALTPVTSGGSSIFAQTIQFRDTGVILAVTPRISTSGIVTLQLAQEVSSAQPNTTSSIVAPVISKSMFQTTAVLRDGQTLALGGIITTSNNTNRNRIPLLGDIPGIGALFGNSSISTARKELVLMITPHVAQDMDEAAGLSNELLTRMKNLKKDLKKLQPPQPAPPPMQPTQPPPPSN